MLNHALSTSDDLLICAACGTQYEVTVSEGKTNCRVCDDPRQFVPPEGQSFTTLSKLREKGHKNVFEKSEKDSKVYEIWTEPKVCFSTYGVLGGSSCSSKLNRWASGSLHGWYRHRREMCCGIVLRIWMKTQSRRLRNWEGWHSLS